MYCPLCNVLFYRYFCTGSVQHILHYLFFPTFIVDSQGRQPPMCHFACSGPPMLGGRGTGPSQVLQEAHGISILPDGSLCDGFKHQVGNPEPRSNKTHEEYFSEGLWSRPVWNLNWFHVFVPYTPDGALATALRAYEKKRGAKKKIRIVERAGVSLKSKLFSSNPWSKEGCVRTGCFPWIPNPKWQGVEKYHALSLW